MDGVDVIDPLRGKDRGRTPIDARREGPLLEMEVIDSSLGNAYGLLCCYAAARRKVNGGMEYITV